MPVFVFTKKAAKIFDKLDQRRQERIRKKLCLLKQHPDILSVLKPLHDFEPATHRLRIGHFRLILHLEKQAKDDFSFLVLDLGPRDKIYR